MEADISQLEAPTFTTINRGPPEPMLRLDWSHKVNLIGEKVLNPMIHCCDKCLKPILIYGRMVVAKQIAFIISLIFVGFRYHASMFFVWPAVNRNRNNVRVVWRKFLVWNKLV